ncbi:hypothetical protein N328_06892, partial [Gavia stellata]
GEDKPLLPVPPILAVRRHWEVRHAAAGRVPACDAFETHPKREKQSHDFSIWEER